MFHKDSFHYKKHYNHYIHLMKNIMLGHAIFPLISQLIRARNIFSCTEFGVAQYFQNQVSY